MKSYRETQSSPAKHMPSIVLVGLMHVAVGYALVTGLARKVVEVIKAPLETKIIADQMMIWHDNLVANIKGGDLSVHSTKKWSPSTWPAEARGVGFTEAPRGMLTHYIVIKDKKIANYQAIVPSTWNGSPRDAHGTPGAYEAALIGTPVEDPEQPVEILRTLHSFDPCLACSTHVMGPDGQELTNVKVR